MTPKEIRGNLLLLLTALIWGSAFVAQSVGLDHLGAFSFNGLRTLLGAFAVMPVALMMQRRQATSGSLKTSLVGGAVCGLILFAASNLQQWGLVETSVGKAGFITALYILFVPLMGLTVGRKVTKLFVAAVGVAIAGMFLLTMRSGEGMALGRGDLLVLMSAVIFAGHILAIDHYSPGANGAMMSMAQFFVSGALSLVAALVTGEQIHGAALMGAAGPILYSGILSCGVAYTLQIVAQKDVSPVVASLLMSLESVFAALCGWLVLKEALSPRELAGCALVFASVILAQWPSAKRADQ